MQPGFFTPVLGIGTPVEEMSFPELELILFVIKLTLFELNGELPCGWFYKTNGPILDGLD